MLNTKKNDFSSFLRNLILIFVCILCIIPLLLVISISISNTDYITKEGYTIIPRTFDLGAYIFILKQPKQLIDSYIVSIVVTILGSAVSLIFTAMLAYPLMRKDYKFSKQITFIVFFTLLFNGGLVPWYILITKYLHLKDSILALILPYLIYPWFVLILRTFFSSIQFELIEAAEIDGAGEFKTFWAIILPMSKPALATIGLLIAFRYWNDWWLGMLFIKSENLKPLQYLLYTIMSNMEEFERNFQATAIMQSNDVTFPREPVRMAMAVLAAGPMLIVFPFFQKYFVRGMAVGAVKG
ncbi:MAG: sugar ABC transporter permease [Clostridiales bacterium GWC2_40_7]|nr:MAG: sugar ABC transporter permease [Clostridiales bacterium GWC2_40_7]